MSTKQPTIAVVGEVFEDRYIIGSVERINPEAPVPILRVTADPLSMGGGAGNVVATLHTLGCDPIPIYQQSYPPTKTRLMSQGQCLYRFDEGDSAWGWRMPPQLPTLDGLIISDYGKGMFTQELLDVLALMPSSVPFFIDTKSHPGKYSFKDRTCVYFPNLREYHEYQTAYDSLARVVLKQGPQGARLLEFGKSLYSSATTIAAPVNVSGAGDVVIAAFTYKYLERADLRQCLNFAMLKAGEACACPYTGLQGV